MIRLNNYDIMDYGKSMYGGWYANIFRYTNKAEYTGEYEGIGANTLRELCAKLKVSRTVLSRDVRRIDN